MANLTGTDINKLTGITNGTQAANKCVVADANVNTGVTNMTNMFNGVTLSTNNYDAILIGWEAQSEQPNVTFSAGNSQYSAGAATTARTALESNGWTITDGGQAA